MEDLISNTIKKQFCTSTQFNNTKPSSYAVAVWRAAHQLIEQPPIFHDPIALQVLGDAKTEVTEKLELHKDLLSTAMRISIAVRSRYAEDERIKSLSKGAIQYVILGAGLDTYAYRSENVHERVFEVDFPATQTIKREKIQKMAIQPSCNLSYVACDFEKDQLQSSLLDAGFDPSQLTFFSWLGVVPYLNETAIIQTLKLIMTCASGSSLVFDYIVEPQILSEIEKMALNILSAQLATGGEPLKSFFDPQQLVKKLVKQGFSDVQDISPEFLNNQYLSNRSDNLRMGNVTRMCKVTV